LTAALLIVGGLGMLGTEMAAKTRQPGSLRPGDRTVHGASAKLSNARYKIVHAAVAV